MVCYRGADGVEVVRLVGYCMAGSVVIADCAESCRSRGLTMASYCRPGSMLVRCELTDPY